MRETFAKEVLPFAISIGISDTQFWNMTKRTFDAYVKAYEMQLKRRDEEMWVQGRYNLFAFETIMAHFGAGLGGKTSTAEYLEKPFSQMAEEQKKLENLTEEEKEMYTKQFFASLNLMQKNFNMAKGKNE